MFWKITHFTITAKEKAVVAFISSTVGSYMVQNGLTIHALTTKSAVWSLIVGVVTHQFVYWTSNGGI